MNSLRDQAMPYSEAPIFIGGLFKSGTTLLRAMLGQHSSIASGLETQWFNMDWDGMKDREFYDHIERLGHFYGFEKSFAKMIGDESKNVIQFLNLFLGLYTKSLGKKRWVEKTPGNILHLNRIYAGWPGAKVIHVIRDPRDVFASLRQAKKWDTIEVFSDLWCQYLGSAERFKKELQLDEEKYLEIRYEAVITRPKEIMKRLLAFLGEPWEDEVAVFKGKKDDYHKVLDLTGKASTTLSRLGEPLTKTRVGIWRNVVSEDEIRQIHKIKKKKGLFNLMEGIEKESLI